MKGTRVFPLHLSSIVSPGVLEDFLLVMNVLGAVAMGVDKFAAVIDYERIPETTLGWIAVGGGFGGVTAAGIIVRHKIRKPYFWVPVGLGWILWSVLLIVYFVPSVIP